MRRRQRRVRQFLRHERVQILDVPVPQKGKELADIMRFFDTLTPDPEQVLEVPKILPDDVLARTAVRDTQLAEQLVEVPTEPGYALAVIASKVFSKRELRGFLSGQGSTASGSGFSDQVVDNPTRGGLQGFPPSPGFHSFLIELIA